MIKNLHIGLLYVRRDDMGRGVGRKLLESAIEKAQADSCDTVTVASAASNEEFYQKCGFKRSGILIESEVPTGKYDVDIEEQKLPLNVQSYAWGRDMPIGRYQSSAFHLFEMRESYALHRFSEISRSFGLYSINGHEALYGFFVSGDESPSAIVYCWNNGAHVDDLVYGALTILHGKAIRRARILLPKNDHDRLSMDIPVCIQGSRSMLVYRL